MTHPPPSSSTLQCQSVLHILASFPFLIYVFGMSHQQHIKLINLGCSIFPTGKDLFSCVLKSFVQRDRCLNTNKQNQLKSYISGIFFAKDS